MAGVRRVDYRTICWYIWECWASLPTSKCRLVPVRRATSTVFLLWSAQSAPKLALQQCDRNKSKYYLSPTSLTPTLTMHLFSTIPITTDSLLPLPYSSTHNKSPQTHGSSKRSKTNRHCLLPFMRTSLSLLLILGRQSLFLQLPEWPCCLLRNQKFFTYACPLQVSRGRRAQTQNSPILFQAKRTRLMFRQVGQNGRLTTTSSSKNSCCSMGIAGGSKFSGPPLPLEES